MIEKSRKVSFKDPDEESKGKRAGRLLNNISLNEGYFNYAGDANQLYPMTSRNSGTLSGKSSDSGLKAMQKIFTGSTLQTPDSGRNSASNKLSQAYL